MGSVPKKKKIPGIVTWGWDNSGGFMATIGGVPVSLDQQVPCTDHREEMRVDDTRGFGVFDRFNREIGAQVRIFMKMVMPETEAERVLRIQRGLRRHRAIPGPYYAVHVYAQRAGKDYGGAGGFAHLFATLVDAKAWAESYFADAEKRARKTAETDALRKR